MGTILGIKAPEDDPAGLFFTLLSSKPSVTAVEDSSMCFLVTPGQHVMPAICAAAAFCICCLPTCWPFCAWWRRLPLYWQSNNNNNNNITIREPVQVRFNKHHLKARCIIEMLFGSMKAQWVAIFLQNPGTRSTVCPKGLTSCAKLHNIWLGVEYFIDDSVVEPTRRPRHVAERMRSARREELAAATSAPVQRNNVLHEHD